MTIKRESFPRVRKVNRNDRTPGITNRIGYLYGLSFALAVGAVALFGANGAEAQDDVEAGIAVFTANCAGCHQSGGVGVPGTFPPLRNNPNATDEAHIRDAISNGLSGPLEVDGVSYDSAMPAVSLSDTDTDAVVAYVLSIAEASDTAEEVEVAGPIEGSAAVGRDLFDGSSTLANGAAACTACHSAGSVDRFGGPGLGPDLTDVVDKLGGEAGLAGWLTNPPANTMAPIFSEHPMTETEVADIAAFLAEAKVEGQSGQSFDWFSVGGVIGLLALVGGMSFFWRGMRQTYADILRSKK